MKASAHKAVKGQEKTEQMLTPGYTEVTVPRGWGRVSDLSKRAVTPAGPSQAVVTLCPASCNVQGVNTSAYKPFTSTQKGRKQREGRGKRKAEGLNMAPTTLIQRGFLKIT